MSDDSTTLTYVTNDSDWEALYIDGEKVAANHLNRLWPKDALDLIEEYNIDTTERIEIPLEPYEPWPETVEEAKER